MFTNENRYNICLEADSFVYVYVSHPYNIYMQKKFHIYIYIYIYIYRVKQIIICSDKICSNLTMEITNLNI